MIIRIDACNLYCIAAESPKHACRFTPHKGWQRQDRTTCNPDINHSFTSKNLLLLKMRIYINLKSGFTIDLEQF